MMEPEKIYLIKKVIMAHMDTDIAFMKLGRALGINLKDSEFYDSIMDPLNDVINAVSCVVGDGDLRWIHWFIASGYGKKPIVAKGREIRTVDDLIWLIDECGKSHPE